MSTSKVTICLI